PRHPSTSPLLPYTTLFRSMAIAASPAERDVMWVGTEPSEVWRSANAGMTWEQTSRLETLPSSSEWSFPPRPDTHHVRWIACHPLDRKSTRLNSSHVKISYA